MKIRRAEPKDADKILDLLSQVLEIHAALRPDLFLTGTTKYTKEELLGLFTDDTRPVYVGVHEADQVMGYAFCMLEEQAASHATVPFCSLYLDDLCVDQVCRGQHVGEQLFEFVKQEAIRLGCYEITLNVWTGNESAEKFYAKMGLKPKKTMLEYVLG